MKKYRIETERGDLFDVNMMIAISVTIVGGASREQLELAFKNAVDSHEILNTRVTIDNSGEAYYETGDGMGNGLYYTDKNISELIREQEKIRFRIEQGEFIRLFVSKDWGEKLQLHFLMHHLGGDGKSLCYFIESFLRSLSGEKLSNNKMALLNRDSLPGDSRLPFLVKKYAGKYNRKWKKEKQVFDFVDMDHAYTEFWNRHQTEIEFYQVEEDDLLKLLKDCHNHDIGFTSYFIAKEIEACVSTQDIGLAVDGRTDGNRFMGNQATGISVRYQYNHSKSVLENAIKIDCKMKKKLSSNRLKYFILRFMAEFEPSLIDAVSLEFAGVFHGKTSQRLARLLGYGKKTRDLSITNLTVLDIPVDYGDYHLESMWFIPPVVSYAKDVIGIVTVNNRMYVARHKYQIVK